jgi:hypothetical protein
MERKTEEFCFKELLNVLSGGRRLVGDLHGRIRGSSVKFFMKGSVKVLKY